MGNDVAFTLPVGYEDENGDIHREGRIRLATALDELEIHNDEKAFHSERFHDVLILSKVVTQIGTLKKIDTFVIENLFEVDFRYLQTIYQILNGHMERTLESRCPICNAVNKIDLFTSYKNIEIYFNKKDKA
jgi:hypothetical protein